MPQQYTVEYQLERNNLLFNPSFESNTYDGSLVGSTATVIASGAYSGTYCLQVVAVTNNTSNEYATPTNQARIVAGNTYTASAYVYITAGVSRNMRLGIRTYDSTGTQLNNTLGAITSITTGGGWQRISASVTAGQNAYYASVYVLYQNSNAAISNAVLIDAMILEPSASLGSYFDGSSSGCYWLGTTNFSPSAQPTSTWVALSDVQQISGTIGKQQVIDTFEPSRMTISARYPTGYSAQNTALKVNTQIRVKRTGGTYTMWTGRIRNVSVQWGIPYTGAKTGVGVADLIDIECEGALAQWGRLQGNDLFVAADDLLTQISAVLSGTNLNYGTTYTASTSPDMSSSTVSDSLANWLNTACATVGATIKDGSDSNIVGVNGRDIVGTLPVQFSDTTNNATNQVYDSIVFDSVSADFFTEIELNTTDYGDVVVTTGIAPFRTLRQTTFSASVSQATDLANYLIGIYGDNGFGISEISCKSEAQSSWALDLGYAWWDIIGYTTFIAFRGTTFRCTITGAAFTATPNESRFTYYVADIGLTPFLILDDTTAGVLDRSKIGW